MTFDFDFWLRCFRFVFGVGVFAKWDLKVLGYSFPSDFLSLSTCYAVWCLLVFGVRYFVFGSLFSESTIPFWLVHGFVVFC